MSNPFEASRAAVGRPEPTGSGPWRRDGRVIAISGEEWPRRCPQCNSELVTEPAVKLPVQWTPRWVYLLLLAGLLPYLIVQGFVRRGGLVPVYLCHQHRTRRTNLQIALWISAVAMLGGFAIGYFSDDPRWLLGGLLALVPLLVCARMVAVVRAKHIEGNRLELVGVHPDFLASLEQA